MTYANASYMFSFVFGCRTVDNRLIVNGN